ncbi:MULTISPECIES: invasin domain 3-containing protein [unclassified Providencia]|uniref:invasin domain 3-containing protein n=1 Tax=unclassified Providencia TaxID=2633465 RepID=UPI00234B7D39|nr:MULTISPECIES: invasin domain 3-containing protein [unclassified Providencia]
MNPATSTTKPTLRHQISNGFVLFTAIWSSAVMPVMPSYAKMLTPDNLPTLGSDPVLTNDDKTAQFIAEYSQSAARFISDKKKAADLADMAQDFARSKATNAATDEINRWLSKTGNAKFSVDVDKKLTIKNTQLDWLVPWYDSTDLLLFTQHNIHRTDARLQTNNGIGVRRFTPESMMGVNAFFDHDLSRYHSRLGFGAEYAQDFLKLSANTYLRTSAWRSAPELNHDSNARPANGWDLHAEGWLPSYPNIGGNLKFEQYFGDDVALFGKDKRQKDPLATTVGVNWTPFSLLTLSAEHKISGGLTETNAKVQLTWALGKSLAEQLDPSKVGDSRRLLGSRYDFVNRNNNIVLEYQKKALITLSLPAMIQGSTGEQVSLINAVNTKYPLDKLTIQAPEFLMAGGEITLDGAATRVKLPSYKVAMTEQERKKINLYQFTVTASDSKGNISPQATTLVEVTNSGVLSISQSEVIKQGNAVANGHDINTLTVTARDSLNSIAPDSTVAFILPAELKLITPKATSSRMAFSNLFKKMQAAKSTDKQKYQVTTNIKGEASIQFTSLVTGEHRVQAVPNGGAPIDTAFFFIADTHQAHINHFNVLSDNAIADGKSKNKIQFHVTDNNAHPIKGAVLQLEAKNATAKQLSPTDEQGNTDVEVKSQVAGPVKITAALNEQSVTVETHFVFGQLAHVTIIDLEQAAAGTSSNITISLTDMHGNAVSGADGTVTVNIDGKPTPITITENRPGSGIYNGKLPGQHTGSPSITVTVDGQTSSPETLIVEQPKPISPNNTNGTGQKGEKGVIDSIIITPSKTHGLQSGDTLDVIVTITDAFGNGLSGLNTDNIDIGKHKGDTLAWTDNGDGSYTTTLPLSKVGNTDLTASINSTTSPKIDVLVNNASGTIHVDKVKITKTEKPAAGTDSIVTIELTDKHGNHVVGETEAIANINGQPHTLPITETSPGIYDVIIPGQLAGNHIVSVIVNGEESPKEPLIVDKPRPVKPKGPSGAGPKGELGVIDNIVITTGDASHLQSGDKLEVIVSITDAFNNGLSGLDTNNINIGKHKGDTLVWVDNGDGSYTTIIPLTDVGNNDLTVSINGSKSPQKQVQVSNAKGKDKVSKVKIIKTEKPAAGSSSILTVQLMDKNDNSVVGETELIVNIDNKPHTLPAKEGKPGIYEVTLPALQAGKHDIHASVNGIASIKESLLVEQPKPISPNNSNGTGQQGEKGVIDKVAITLDHTHRFESGNPLEITVAVTDAFGNGLAGLNTDNIDIGKHKGNTLNWVDNGDGSYTTTLTLTDVGSNDLTTSINGTRSPHTEVQVNNASGTTHVDKVKITKTEKPAAGANSLVTIEFTDKHGNPVVGEIEITVNIDGQPHKLPAKERKSGGYEVTLPALQAGNHSISVNVNGKNSTDTTLVVNTPTPIKSKKPDGTGTKGEKGVVDNIAMTTGDTHSLQSGDQLELTVSITDAFGNGLTELNTNNITLDGYNGKPVWTDNGDGSYTTTLTLTEMGSKDLTTSINGHKTAVKSIQVNPAKGKNKVSKIGIIQTEKPTAGSTSTLTVQLTDNHGNPVVGEHEMVIEIDGFQHTLPVKEGKSGIYEITLPALQAGDHKITATVNGQSSAKNTLEVKKPAPIRSNNSSGTGNRGERGVINNITMTTGDTTRLQSGDKLAITVTIVDAFNNPLTAIDTSNIILDGYTTSSLKWLDNGNGTYTTPLLLTQTGSNDLLASINGYKSQLISITVSNTADINKVANIELEPISPSEAGENQTITVKVTDRYQHPVTMISSMITANIDGQSTSIILTESLTQAGIYTGTLPAKNMGKYTVKATANNKTVSKLWTVKTAAIIAVKEKDGSGTKNQRGVVNTVALASSSANDLKSGQLLQLTVTLKDGFGNALEGVSGAGIQLKHQQPNVSPVIWTDLRNGNYTAILPLTKIGQDTLTVKVNQITSSPLNINVGSATGTSQIKQVKIKDIATPAAGETSSITLLITDAHDQPITGVDNNAVVSIDGAEALLKITETVNKGTYTGTLSGQKSGDHKVIVTVGGVKSTGSTLTVSAPSPITRNPGGKSGTHGVVSRAKLTVLPNKNLKSGDTLTLTVTLEDAFGNPLTGVDLAQSLTHKQAGNVTWIAQKDGTYTANLVLTKLGQDHLFITADNIQSPTMGIDVKPQLGNNAIHKIDISDITNPTAGAESTFTAVLTDAQGNTIDGIQNLEVTIGKQPLNIAITQQADGRYMGKLPGQQSGSYDLIVSVNKQNSAKKTFVVAKPDTVTASPNGSGQKGQRGVVSQVELTTAITSAVSGHNLPLTITLKDRFNNPLKGVSSNHITLMHKQTGHVAWVDHNNGQYTATIPLKILGNDTFIATVNGINSSATNITVTNSTNIKQVNQLVMAAIPPSAAGSEQTMTVQAIDINSYGVTHIADDIKVTLNDKPLNLTFVGSQTDKGTYITTLPAQKTGNYQVKVTANKQTAQQTWQVAAAKAIQATKADASGAQGQAGVVNTLELATTQSSFKSGDTTKLTLTLKDAFDNPLSGIEVKNITLAHNQTGQVTWVDNKNGTYTADLLLTTLGKDHLAATVNQIKSAPVGINVEKAIGNSRIHQVDIVNIASPQAGAEGVLTVSLTDINGHVVMGITEVAVNIGKQQPLNIAVTQQADGSYTGKLPGQQSGSYDLIVSVNKQNSAKKTFVVAKPDTVTASPNGSGQKGLRGVVSQVELTTAATSAVSGDNLPLTVTLKDRFNNPLKGVSSNHITLMHKQTGHVTWVDHNNGQYTTTLPLKVLGNDAFTATVNGINSSAANITVTNSTDIKQVNQLVMAAIPPSAAGSERAMSVQAVDGNGHGVTHIADDIKVTLNDKPLNLTFVGSQTDKGTYIATLPAQKTGNYLVKVAANKQKAQQTWQVTAAKAIQATKVDGSGVQGQAGVVKTVELATAQSSFKSGDTTKLTLTLKDAFDNALSSIEVKNITLTHNQTGQVTWVDNKNGTYTADLALKTIGEDTLTATVNNISSQTVDIEVINSKGANEVKNVDVIHILPVAAGADSTVIVSLTDKNGHPVSNITSLSVIIDQQKPFSMSVGQAPSGNYVGTLPGQQSGQHNIVVSIPTTNTVSNKKPFDVSNPAPIAAAASDGGGKKGQHKVVNEVQFIVAPTANLKAGNKVTLTIMLKDAFGNGLKEVSSNSLTIIHQQSGSVIWKDNADGTYTADLLLSKLGTDTLKVTANGISQSQVIDVKAPQSTSVVNNMVLKAINKVFTVGDLAELQLTLTDSHGNGVEKVQANDIQLEHNHTPVPKLAWLEKGAGIYTTTLPLHQQGKNIFVSRVNHQTNTPLAIHVSALTGPAQVKIVELKASTNQLTVGSKTELTLILADQWNNGVEGVMAKDITINDAHIKKNLTGLNWLSKGNGTYTASTTVAIAGVHSLKATVNLIQSKNVLVNALPSTNQNQINKVQLTTNLSTITAGSNVMLSLKVTDRDNNPVIHLNNNTITLTDSNNKISAVWDEDNHGLGIYSTNIMLHDVRTHRLVASIGQFTDTTNVTVNSPSGNNAVKTITISPIANSDTGQLSSLSIGLTDQYKNPVKNVSNSDISVTINGQKQNIIFMEKNGLHKYTAQLPAAKAGRYKIKVEINGQAETAEWVVNPPIAIPIISYDKDGLRGSLETISITHSAKNHMVNSGDKVTLTVGLKDKFDNKLTGAASSLKLLTDLHSTSAWKELSGGLYTQELTMNKLRKQSIQVVVDKLLSDKLELTVTPAKGANNVHKTTLETHEGTIEAGKEVQLTLTLTDSVNNGVVDINTKDIQLTNNGKLTNVTWVNPQDGVYTTKQRLDTIGEYRFKATVNNQPSRIQTVEATYPSGKDVVKSAKMTTNLNKFDAGKKVELTLELKDQYGNLVTGVNGVDIALKDSHTAETIDSRNIAWHMASVGVYKATLPLTKVGKHTLTATVNSISKSTPAITVTALKGVNNVKEIKLTANNTSIKAGENTTLNLTMLDSYGNEVTGIMTKDIMFKNTDSTITTNASWVKTPSNDNVYTAQVTLEKVKKHTLSVEVNKQVKNVEIEVKPQEGAQNVAKVELNAPITVAINDDANLQLSLKDKFGNGVVAVDISDITLKHLNTLIPIAWVEGKEGKYTSNLALTKAATHPLEVKVNGYSSVANITVENPKGVKNVANINMKPSITADSSGKLTTNPGKEFKLAFTLTDQYGNGVTELKATDINLAGSQKPSSVPITAWQENVLKKGEYIATVSLIQTAQHVLTAKVNTVSDTAQISVTPFSHPDYVASVELKLAKTNINIGENVKFELKAKDKYGNDVFVNESDIAIHNKSQKSSEIKEKWDITKDTFTRQYKGTFRFTKPGEYIISAIVGKANSNSERITIEAGAPVFASGKSTFTVSNDETSTTDIKNTEIKLVLKDDNGHLITGKKPKLEVISSTTHKRVPKDMTETSAGTYTAEHMNAPDAEIAQIKLFSDSINYKGSDKYTQIVNYGKMSITRLGVEETYQVDDRFPSTGFTGAQFAIEPSLGFASEYKWEVNQNWLTINEKGVVTMKTQPESPRSAKVTITGKPKRMNSKNMVYTFNMDKWFSAGPKLNLNDAMGYCTNSQKIASPEDIKHSKISLFTQWPEKTINDNMKLDQIAADGWIWTITKYMTIYHLSSHHYLGSRRTTGDFGVVCVKEY